MRNGVRLYRACGVAGVDRSSKRATHSMQQHEKRHEWVTRSPNMVEENVDDEGVVDDQSRIE